MSRSQSYAAVLLATLLGVLAAPSAGGAADRGQASRAARSLHAAFPELAAAPSAPGSPSGLAIAEYVGAEIAKVVDRRGRRSVLLSSMPLRSSVGDGSLRPLSLALRSGDRGEVRPENPVTEVRIATDPAEGFTIGPDPLHLVTIVPLGLRADASAGTPFAGQILFAGARESADLLLRPSPTGVQTFEQLTGEAAPESYAYRLDLAPGQSADLADGVVTIRQAGEIIARACRRLRWTPIAAPSRSRSVSLTTLCASTYRTATAGFATRSWSTPTGHRRTTTTTSLGSAGRAGT